MSKNKTATKKEEVKEWVVVKGFYDGQDNNKMYVKGEPFDAKGIKKDRIKELASNSNKLGEKVIEPKK